MLRRVFISLSACLTVSFSVMAEPLQLSLENVGSDQGQVVVQVYNSKKSWMSEKTKKMVLRQAFPAKQLVENPTVTLDLDFGEYAIQVYHDLDSNDEMKTNWIGIPKEPVGTSNNAKGSMGPPKYKDAKFVFDAQNSKHALTIVDI